MKKWLLSSFGLLFSLLTLAHGMDEKEEIIPVKQLSIYGTLSTPAHNHNAVPLIIIIAGSGPTDRDGNQPGLHPDTYKKMAQYLATQGIAMFRYDKRGAGKSISTSMKEAELRFDHYVDDAKEIILHFNKDPRFSSVTVAGHSEGSLIGMMALTNQNDFISLCGAGQPAPTILKNQLRMRLGEFEAPTFKKIDSLQKGMTVTCDQPMLMSLLRPSVQPYLISWFKIDPSNEIKKVKSRILLVGGNKDLQVSADQLRTLELVAPNAQTILFANMNHVLVNIQGTDMQENYSAYNNPDMPLSSELMQSLVAFIRKEKYTYSE